MIPIFPELKGPLQEAWDRTEEGQSHVLPELQRVDSPYQRKHLLAAIRAAGGQPGPKLQTALRATRDTELRELFPVHVVESWMSPKDRVANRNDTQVTEDHFRRWITQSAGQGGAKSGTQAAHFPVQQASARSCRESQASKNTPAFSALFAASDNTVPLSATGQGGDDRTRTCTGRPTRS